MSTRYTYIMNTADIYEEKRPWGGFRRFTHDEKSTVKIITIDPSQSISLQTHAKREEFWRIISGSGTVEVNGVPRDVKKGDECTILLGEKHRATAGMEGLVILEIATGEFDENDIIRYEDKYGRK